MQPDTEQSEAKQRIIKTALNLFYKQGYLATGINQVIAESGVTKNTFYYHFHSKDDLCVAYLQHRHKIWMGWLVDHINKETTPFRKIAGLFEFLEKWLTECDFRGCAFLNIATEVPDVNHRIRKEVIVHSNELRTIFQSMLADLKKSDKHYSHIDVPLLSDFIYILFEGTISSCQNYGDSKLIKNVWKSFEKMLKHQEKIAR
jgi:AcrR family transcriptional regulator